MQTEKWILTSDLSRGEVLAIGSIPSSGWGAMVLRDFSPEKSDAIFALCQALLGASGQDNQS